MFSMVGESWSFLSMSRSLCLGAQTSVDRLYELVELVRQLTCSQLLLVRELKSLANLAQLASSASIVFTADTRQIKL